MNSAAADPVLTVLTVEKRLCPPAGVWRQGNRSADATFQARRE